MIIICCDKGDSYTAIILQGTNASNQYAAHLKFTQCCMSVIFTLSWEKKKTRGNQLD